MAMETLKSLETLPENAIFSLSDWNIVKISGTDRLSFLQGQLTINVSSLPPNIARVCAQCDPKGKMVGLGHIVAVEDEIWFVQHKNGSESSLAQFNKYGVFAKAEFASNSTLHGYAFTGPNAQQASQQCQVYYAMPEMSGVFIGWTDNKNMATSFQNELYPADVFAALCIKSGLPFLESPMASEWIPQMVNVQALHGIDFDKGCYLGQEVVARTRYLGRNKRQAFILKSEQNPTRKINAGDTVEQQLGENWRKAGNVINAISLPQETWILAVLPNDFQESTPLRLEDNGVDNLSVMPLPYIIEKDESLIKKRKPND